MMMVTVEVVLESPKRGASYARTFEMPMVPRIGEKLIVGNGECEVQDVEWTLENTGMTAVAIGALAAVEDREFDLYVAYLEGLQFRPNWGGVVVADPVP